MAGLQADGHFVGQHPAAGNVHHRRQVHKAVRHGDVGSVQCPDLVGRCDRHVAQQVGVDLVPGCGFAGSGLWGHGLDAHALHQGAHVDPAHHSSLAFELAYEHALAHEGVLQVQLVNSAHERQVSFAGGSWCVVHRAPADLQQLGLLAHR